MSAGPVVVFDRAADARDAFEDIVSLCGKVTLDMDERSRVCVDDLVELRDRINDLRRLVANGAGYAAVPELVRPGEDA